MGCVPFKTEHGIGYICSGHRGVAPIGKHFGWDDDMYPAITDDPDNIIGCLDCGEPAIVCDFWAFSLDMAYCENCAYVHKDIKRKEAADG